jgi:glyoxalase family protein
VAGPPSAGITGIHHLTAVSSDAQRTVDFYTALLGLRLIGQTVDPDNPFSYYLSFADEADGPGSLDFRERRGAPRGQWGIGGTHHLAFETQDRETLRQWKRWLMDHGVPATGPYDRVYFESIYFTDPDGLILEIATRGPGWTVDEDAVALGQELRLPPRQTTINHRDEAAISADTWPENIPSPTPEMRLRRLHHITAIGSAAAELERFFTDLLGMRLVKRTVNFDNPSSPHLYWGVGDGAPGTIVTYFAYPRGTVRQARRGAGLTDHFALSVPNEAALAAWRDYLNAAGTATTDVEDRGFSRSIALHDPDGQPIRIVAQNVDSPESAMMSGRALHLPRTWSRGGMRSQRG